MKRISLVFALAFLVLASFPLPSVLAGEDGWTTTSLAGFNLRALVLDPTGTGAIYLLTDQDVLVSQDEGVTWRAIGLAQINAMAIDPSDAQHWWVAAQGALYVRKDSGQSWEQQGKDVLNAVQQIVVRPDQPTTVYVSTRDSIFRSTDGGQTWGTAGLPASGRASAVVFDTLNPNTLYIALADQRGQLWKSTDEGKTWVSIGDRLPAGRSPAIFSLSVDSNGTLYVATDAGVFSSSDGGSGWNTLTDTYANILAADPAVPGSLYINFSYNGFYRVETATSNYIRLGENVFGDVYSMALAPGGAGKIFVLADNRFFFSKDHGASWASPDSTQMNVVWSVGRPNTIFASSGYDATLFRSSNRGATWTKLDLNGVQAVAGAPKTVDTIYTGTRQGLFVSRDGGGSWQTTGLPSSISVRSVAVNPSNEQTLYVGKDDGLVRSEDGGQSWASLNLPQNIGAITQIAVASDGSAIYIVANNAIYQSTDGGQAWAKLYSSPNGTPIVSLSPSDPQTTYVGSVEGVGISRNRGLSLAFGSPFPGTTLSYNSWISVAEDPRGSHVLYAVISDSSNSYLSGLYVSADSGRSWSAISGLPFGIGPQSFSFSPGDPPALYLTLQNGRGGVWQYTPLSLPPTPTPTFTATFTPTITLTPTLTPIPTFTPPPGSTAGPTPTAWLQIAATKTPVPTPRSLGGVTPSGSGTGMLFVGTGLACLCVAVLGAVAVFFVPRIRQSKPATTDTGSGTDTSTIFCESCGKPNVAEANNCVHCGKPLIKP